MKPTKQEVKKWNPHPKWIRGEGERGRKKLKGKHGSIFLNITSDTALPCQLLVFSSETV
jgi:hypothetical protein